MNVMPIMMIKNEEIWIRRIVEPIVQVFGTIIIGDTGSTDGTIDEIRKIHGDVKLICYDQMTPDKMGKLRGTLQAYAKTLGFSHVFLIDGDELYPVKYLAFIRDNPMPEDAPCGFTTGNEICEIDNGELWLYPHQKNRDAVFSVNSKWRGIYPYEGHSAFNQAPEKNYYWQSPDETYRFWHLHNVTRSTKDADAHMRDIKRSQFSMMTLPIYPDRLWLKSEKDYIDENLHRE